MKKDQAVKYLSYPQGIFVVGTYDKLGKPNVVTIALGGMCSHEPPSFAISLRPATCSFENVRDRQAFTVNVPSRHYIEHVDYFGLVSGRDFDKLEVCGLTAARSDKVDAPYIEEFPTIAECSVRHAVDLGSHTMFVAEIMGIKGEEGILTNLPDFGLDTKDVPDMIKAEGIVYIVTGGHRYYCGLGAPLGKAYSVGRHLIHGPGKT